jgi:2-oxoglutarate dehydrogenase E2 component (dihydrolipoamide succinyltransferase)
MIEVIVPEVGESITEVQVSQWLKSEGDWVNAGEDLVEVETEKASVQIPAKASGFLRNLKKRKEEFAAVGEVIAELHPSEVLNPANEAADKNMPAVQDMTTLSAVAKSLSANLNVTDEQSFLMPAAKRLAEDLGLDIEQIPASGPGGRLLKEDIQRHFKEKGFLTTSSPQEQSSLTPKHSSSAEIAMRKVGASSDLVTDNSLLATSLSRVEELKPMSMLRRTIAARLVQAQQTAALLTTFNEVDMSSTIAIRNKYKDVFAQKHGVKLGFMPFFSKAAVDALRRFPAVNAEIRGNHIVYRNYQDIGIAIGGGKGLVVPVLRNVEKMSFADIERGIAAFAEAAGQNRIQPTDLEGGTFTISNGGIYGSLLSTPIVNPPQSGILGLHTIQERPVAVDGQVAIRPMMYIALTYDHRIVDGREAVTFLKTIKELIEDPSRLFLDV